MAGILAEARGATIRSSDGAANERSRVYTWGVAELGRNLDTWCPNCGRSVDEADLEQCVICRKHFCPYCGETGFGRRFCSLRCRDFFFFGEGDEAEEAEG